MGKVEVAVILVLQASVFPDTQTSCKLTFKEKAHQNNSKKMLRKSCCAAASADPESWSSSKQEEL